MGFFLHALKIEVNNKNKVVSILKSVYAIRKLFDSDLKKHFTPRPPKFKILLDEMNFWIFLNLNNNLINKCTQSKC